MMFSEPLRTGFVEIWSHKLRSFLSFSAIMFGVAAILYTFAEVNRMYERREKAMDLAGPGRIEIREDRDKEVKDSGLSKGLTIQDAAAIRETLPWLYMVSPSARAWLEFQHGDFKSDIQVEGVSLDWRKRGWVYTLRGRFFDEADVRSAARVVILDEPGGWAEEKPFWAQWWKDTDFQSFVKHNDLLGKTVFLKHQVFTVIGVLRQPPKDKDPRWFRQGGGGSAFVPISTAQRYLTSSRRGDAPNPDAVDEIIVDTGDVMTVPGARRAIEALLDSRHRGVKDFKIDDFREMVQGMLNRMKEYAVAVLSVGIVAILAGGIGIMNVPLATIFSRIREIGIRRAVGATRLDIIVQFITEAMLLGLLGGVAGIGLGLVGLNYLSREGSEQIQSLVWWHFLALLGISVGAGFLFSLYPAYQASKLDPVDALRYE